MNNEEKSKEIAEKTLGEFATSFLGYIDEVSETFCECAAMKMAEWKDDIIRERLDLEIEKANAYYDNNKNVHEMDKHIGAVIALSEILGIKFPYDKLHMGFATLD